MFLSQFWRAGQLFCFILFVWTLFCRFWCVVCSFKMAEPSPRHLGSRQGPRKKDVDHFAWMQDSYREFISSNELLTVPYALDAMTAGLSPCWLVISILGIWSGLQGVLRKALKVSTSPPKCWRREVTLMWDILLGNKEPISYFN